MIEGFTALSAAQQALVAGLFTWSVTAVGAASFSLPEDSLRLFWSRCSALQPA